MDDSGLLRTALDHLAPETTKPSYFYEGFVLYGAGTRNRTRDLLITSQRAQGYPLIYESI